MLEEASITLNPDNVLPEVVSAGASLSDFSAKATFDNPISGSFRDFSYGISFRESEGSYHAVSINSAGDVRYLEGTRGEEGSVDTFTVIETFDYENILTGGSDSNSMHLTVAGDQAWLYVNGEYVDQFTVGGVAVTSDVEFVAEFENETQITGAITRLTAPEVRDGQAAVSIASETMIKEAGEITRSEATGLTRDFVVEAKFVSPYERILDKWSVGFEFADPLSGAINWVVINNSKQWKHYRQANPGAQIEEIDGGVHNGILRDRDDVNQLYVIGQNGSQRLLINGAFVSVIDLQPELLPIQISAISGFDADDQKDGFKTMITDYVAWTFGN